MTVTVRERRWLNLAGAAIVEVNWSFLGLSMPAWVLIWFVLLAGLSVYANFSRARRPTLF